MKLSNRLKTILRIASLALAAGTPFLSGLAQAQTVITSGNTFNINDGNSTQSGNTRTFNDSGSITTEGGGTLAVHPSQSDNFIFSNDLIFAGAGGTINFKFNNNDTDYRFQGPISSSATGAQTLRIETGFQGNGDRESVTFDQGIPDVGDSSALSLFVSFSSQTGSQSYVNLSGDNTFTGSITLEKGDNVQEAYLTIGGLKFRGGNTTGSGRLGGGDFAGNISLDTNTILYYDSSASQILSGAISGAGSLTKDGSGELTLSGASTFTGNTTVSNGTLVLDDAGDYTFNVTNASSNKITGGGTATIGGNFTINTAAVTAAVGNWTLVDTAAKSFGGTFSMTGFTGPVLDVFTKVDGTRTWTFDTTTGVLSLSSVATITSFSIPGSSGSINQSAKTILLYVPTGTTFETLAPSFTVTSGTCNQTSGSVPSPTFVSPGPSTVHYVVTDGATENDYAVTIAQSPLPQSGLQVWLKADSGTQVDGSGNVSQWDDSSGSSNNASNGNAGDRPQYVAGALNGQPVLRFTQDDDDNGDRLYLGDLSSQFPSEATVFVVSTINNDGRYNLFGNRDNDERWVADSWSESHPGSFRNGRADGTFNQGSWPTSGSHVFALESSSSVYRALIDGAVIGSDSPEYNSGNGNNWTIGNRSENGQQLNGDIAEVIIYNRVLSESEAAAVGQYLTQKYALTTSYVPQAKITSFGPGGSIGALSGNAAAITWYLPNGTTDFTALTPTFTLSSGATCTVGGLPASSGEAHNFTSPVAFVVTSSDLAITNTYTVTVQVLPPGPPVAGYTRWFDASAIALADGAAVSEWTDGSSNGANATVPSGNATPTYVANSGMESGKPAIFFPKNSGAGNSGAFVFARESNVRTVFAVRKGSSFLLTDTDAYNFHSQSDDDPSAPMFDGNSSDRVRNGSTYVNGSLVDGTSFNMPTEVHNGFNLVEVITTDNVQTNSFNKDRVYHAGNQYLAEVIIYDFALSEEQRAQVEAYLTNKWFTATTGTDYDTWATSTGVVGGANDDDDGDGRSNFDEYAFGLNPTSGASVNPYTAPFDKSTGTFSYSRRLTSLTNLSYTYESSTTLQEGSWTPFTPETETSNSGNPIEVITIGVPAVLLAEPELYIRVKADVTQ